MSTYPGWHDPRDTEERAIDDALARNPVAPYPWHDWNQSYPAPCPVRQGPPPLARQRGRGRSRALAELDLWSNADNMAECGERGCSVVVTLSGVRRTRALRDSEALLEFGAELVAPSGAWYVYAERFNLDEVALHAIPQVRDPDEDEADHMLGWLARQVSHSCREAWQARKGSH
jgi:hypothetical protein